MMQIPALLSMRALPAMLVLASKSALTAALLFAASLGMWSGMWSAAHAADKTLLPSPVDLHADGIQSARHGKPIVILFSLPDCAYCKVVRENYLAPLLREKSAAKRPIIREIEITAGARFTGFRREQLSHSDMADRYGVHFAPTVLFLDNNGQLLTEPIIGGDTAGMYGGYLDNTFAEANRKLAASTSNKTTGDKK